MTAGDEVADDIIAALDAHGYVIVSRAEEWALLVAGVDAREEPPMRDLPHITQEERHGR